MKIIYEEFLFCADNEFLDKQCKCCEICVNSLCISHQIISKLDECWPVPRLMSESMTTVVGPSSMFKIALNRWGS